MTDPSESAMTVVSVLPKDAIPSIDDPTFGDDYVGDPDDEVLVVEPADCGVLGFQLSAVKAAGGTAEATVGETDVMVLATTDGLHAFERPDFELRVEDGTVSGDGATWTPATGESDDGGELRRVPTCRLYAFAWQDDHGPESFFTR